MKPVGRALQGLRLAVQAQHRLCPLVSKRSIFGLSFGAAKWKQRTYERIDTAFDVSPIRDVPSHIVRPQYVLHPDIPLPEMDGEVVAMPQQDIGGMKKACQLARQALDYAASFAVPGATTDEIDAHIHEFIISHNAYPSTLGYCGFPKSCCTSVNNVIVHGIPDSRRLQDGDIVKIDVTVYIDGFHGDNCQTIAVGSVDEDAEKLMRISSECLEKGISVCRPGVRYSEIGAAVEKLANSHGFAVNESFNGHGIGRHFHLPPYVPAYASDLEEVMDVGHVFTIEPVLHEGSQRHSMLSDGWTMLTTDGSRAAQNEHTVLITETGVEVMTVPN